MTHFPPKNQPLPIPDEPYVSQELYEAAHKNFAIGYTDVVLRDPESGKFFFPTRGVEPEKGKTWFIGGRIAVGDTIEQSAARHVKHDAGLVIPSSRFSDVSHFSIAHVTERPGREQLVRHALNNVLVANLKPEEVQTLNDKVADNKMSKEYSGGAWYNPELIRKNYLIL
ncbi:MAG TPA: hypothetical protein VMR28_02680 [Candidatus Saccharimonadales bacterium]|nr:hypothetical protein [Candidatus Saccharimonadales bacterium]